MNHLHRLSNYIQEQASEAKWSVTPQVLRTGAISEESAEPAAITAIVVDIHFLLMADLGTDLKKARSAWAAAQRQAALARTNQAAAFGDDVMLLFTGPSGSLLDKDWNALAMEIERNDLVCRKLVWLPPAKEPDLKSSMSEFVLRTFLSKPWLKLPGKQVELDQLAGENRSLRGWNAVLDAQPVDRADVDYDQLVTALIRTYQP